MALACDAPCGCVTPRSLTTWHSMFYICSMFDSTADTPTPAVPAVSSARERMGILRRMSEIGLRMAERLDRQSEIAALHAESSAVPEQARPDCAHRLNEMTRSFAQVSRAVSVCVALEDRIERGPPIPQPAAFRPRAGLPRSARKPAEDPPRRGAGLRARRHRRLCRRRALAASKTSAAAWTTCSTAKSPPSTPSSPAPSTRPSRGCAKGWAWILLPNAAAFGGGGPPNGGGGGFRHPTGSGAASESQHRKMLSILRSHAESAACRFRLVKVAPFGRAAERQACGLTLSSPNRQAKLPAWIQGQSGAEPLISSQASAGQSGGRSDAGM